MWVRLILENSTVCLISRRISLLCPVDISLLAGLWVGGWWCRGFFDDDSDNMSVSFFVMDVALIDSPAGLLLWWWVGGYVFDGEFDPGSGRTLAACLTHASRAERPLRWYSSGERVSNT